MLDNGNYSFKPSRFATLFGIGRDWTTASFNGSAFFVSRVNGTRNFPFTSLKARTIRNNWFFSSIQIDIDSSESFHLKGIRRSKASVAFSRLAERINAAATYHLECSADEILETTHRIADCLSGHRYISHSEAIQLRDRVKPHLFILWTRPTFPNIDRLLDIVKSLAGFHENYESIRASTNAVFLAKEPSNCADFFRTIEKQPLTEMQVRAVLTDEDVTLVLAGAGSGKTSVIVGKIAYLLHRALRKPQEILALAYSRESSQELQKRIDERIGQPVRASTFHALGLSIIGECEGRRPAVSKLAKDPAMLRKFISDKLNEMLCSTPELSACVVTWFIEYLVPYRGPDLTEDPLRTWQGDLVKSLEEQKIANFLFTNGIDYEYEAPYEIDTATSEKGQYKPDFKIGKGIYIEHFAIDREGRTPHFIPQTEYTEGIA